MSAAESTSRTSKQSHGPRAGEMAPSFTLPDTSGGKTRLFDFRQRQPVLLAFLHASGCPACRAWLTALARRRPRLDELGVAVLVVVPEPIPALRSFATELDLPFHLLSDADGALSTRYGLPGEHPSVAVFALNRYGAVLDAWHADEASALPPMEAPLDSIVFAEMEDCGCGLPAWPRELMEFEDEE